MMKVIKTTMGMLAILIFFFYNTHANEPNQFVIDGEFSRFNFQTNYDQGLNVVIVDIDSLGIHLKLIQFENSKKSVYRLELPIKNRLRDPRQVGLVNLTKNDKDLFVTSGNWLFHYRKSNNEYKIKDHFEFESLQHDAFVIDFDNYNTISISSRILPENEDMNKWTVKTNDAIIKGVLPDYDYPTLLKFIPRQPYDIFENKVLISNILKDSYYIINLEDGNINENSLDIFIYESEMKDNMNMEEVVEKLKVTEQIIRSSFIDKNRIIITSKAKRNNILELRHDIINYKDNKILKTYFEPLDNLLTNKNIKFGQQYYVSGNKIISLHRIPFTVDKSDKEYFIKDSVNSYYENTYQFKSLIRIDEI